MVVCIQSARRQRLVPLPVPLASQWLGLTPLSPSQKTSHLRRDKKKLTTQPPVLDLIQLYSFSSGFQLVSVLYFVNTNWWLVCVAFEIPESERERDRAHLKPASLQQHREQHEQEQSSGERKRLSSLSLSLPCCLALARLPSRS